MNPEDITALKQTVARFVEQRITPSMGTLEAAGEFPRSLIEAMGSAGLFGAAFPEALGGSAMGFHAVAVIAEDALGLKDANRHPPRNRFAQEKNS